VAATEEAIMASTVEVLAEVPLFSLLDEQERAALAERVDLVRFAVGQVIFNYGDPGDSMYIVKAGRVEIWVRNDTGDKIVLEEAQPGDFFGEISLLDGGPRNATAVVVEELDAIKVDRADLDELVRIKPPTAMDLLTATGRRLRETSRLLRHTASRNVNREEEDHRTRVMKVADWISDFSGSLPFLFIHVAVFFGWIVLNIQPLVESRIGGFDPFPFGLLTMVVSLEAIVLSVFVLLSQNRQAARDRVRNDIEFAVNLKAELQIAHMHKKVDEMHAEILRRLDRLERR
jgi:CRP/FNR family cyclic AMP-dependent transcriptional regulator